MRRLFVLVALGIAFPLAAIAAPPVHFKQTLGPLQNVFDAGTFCDFKLIEEYVIVQSVLQWFDADGNLVRISASAFGTTDRLNVETGQTTTDAVHYHYDVDFALGTLTESGQVSHMYDASGHLIFVAAGRFVMDATGRIISQTPNAHYSDGPEWVCPALGGAPAQ